MQVPYTPNILYEVGKYAGALDKALLVIQFTIAIV
jgi:hypothetical protein